MMGRTMSHGQIVENLGAGGLGNFFNDLRRITPATKR